MVIFSAFATTARWSRKLVIIANSSDGRHSAFTNSRLVAWSGLSFGWSLSTLEFGSPPAPRNTNREDPSYSASRKDCWLVPLLVAQCIPGPSRYFRQTNAAFRPAALTTCSFTTDLDVDRGATGLESDCSRSFDLAHFALAWRPAISLTGQPFVSSRLCRVCASSNNEAVLDPFECVRPSQGRRLWCRSWTACCTGMGSVDVTLRFPLHDPL